MRFLTITSLMAALAAMVSAHDVNCWGKALHPPRDDVEKAIHFLDRVIFNTPHNALPPIAKAEARSCSEQYCHDKVSIRFCNEDNVIKYMKLQNVRDSVRVLSTECQADYKGKRVAGGVVDHPDKWNVVVQAEDKC